MSLLAPKTLFYNGPTFSTILNEFWTNILQFFKHGAGVFLPLIAVEQDKCNRFLSENLGQEIFVTRVGNKGLHIRIYKLSTFKKAYSESTEYVEISV